MEYQKTELSRTGGRARVSLRNPLTLFQNRRVQEISVKHHGMVWDLAALNGAEHRLCINSGFIKG